MIRSQGVVDESPPALGQAEHDVDPAARLRGLDQHQDATRRQQAANVGEALANVAGRVQHVGSDDQIQAFGCEALWQRVLLNVQLGEIEVGMHEALGRRGKEELGEIGEAVAGAAFGQCLEQGRGGPTGAGTHLQYPQHPPWRQARPQPAYRLAQQRVDRPRIGRAAVEVGRAAAVAREQQCQRIDRIGEHVGKPRTGTLDQQQLGGGSGVALDECGEVGLRLVDRRCRQHAPSRPDLLQLLGLGEDHQQPAQQPPMAIGHAQLIGQGTEREQAARAPVEPQPAQRLPDEVRGDPVENLGGLGIDLDAEPFAQRLRQRSQMAAQRPWIRQEVGCEQALQARTGLELDRVERVSGAGDGLAVPERGRRDRPELDGLDERDETRIVLEPEPGQNAAARALGHGRRAQPRTGLAQQMRPPDPGRHQRGAGIIGWKGCGHYLQGGVEQRGVQRIGCGRPRRLRQCHHRRGSCLAVPTQIAQAAKRWAVDNAATLQLGVEAAEVNHCPGS